MKDNALRNVIFKDCRKAMGLTVLFSIFCDCAAGILSVRSATILGNFADAVLNMDMAYGMQNIVALTVCILITIVFIPVLNMFSCWIMLKDALVHDRMVLGRFLDKSYLDAAKLDAGDVQQRLEGDPNDFRIYWVLIVTRLCMAFVTAASLAYSIRDIYWGFICCAIGLMLIKICAPAALKKIRAKYDRKRREYQTTLRAGEAEITEKPHIVRLWGLSEPLIGRLDGLFQSYYKNVFKKNAFYTAVADTASSYLDTFCILAILFTGAVMTARGLISAGQVAAMTGYFAVLNSILENISYIITNFPVMNNMAERMEVLYSTPEAADEAAISETATGETATGEDAAGTFTGFGAKDLSFAYDDNTAFQYPDFAVKSGDKLAVCGDNGSGKSTLIKLLCGLYDKYSGQFLINGRGLERTNVCLLRRLSAYAMQEPFLFSGTVKDNVRLGNPGAGEEKIAHVMKEWGIDALAGRRVSMNQNDLSGGEKQKISIARAVLKDSPILVLDEPEGGLDGGSADKLIRFIRTTEKTVILITHDRRLLEAADHVLRL